ncbi:CLUMA_CG001599, isoform A [Clunio marinus]|uniref:CLUMA_CG001599, isoform A n=1 Tax=Clunio marinus TaxID=568069 RepID=A0A1J1HIH6_9DIPT|nr:CLUMA_CG001599, isoform A [Clunio marinus]
MDCEKIKNLNVIVIDIRASTEEHSKGNTNCLYLLDRSLQSYGFWRKFFDLHICLQVFVCLTLILKE